jgi:hypothetical protein
MHPDPHSPADHVVLVGTGVAAMAALWRLSAGGIRIRWYAGFVDVAEEAMLAHALGRGRVALSLEDPRGASLDGATALLIAGDASRHAGLAERARANGVTIHHVERAHLPVDTHADIDGVAAAH